MFGYMLYFTDALESPVSGQVRRRRGTGTEGAKRQRRKVRGLRTTLLVAAAGAFVTTAALAESARMSSPNQTVSLREGPLDVEASWVRLEDNGYEVTATFIGRAPDAEPSRVVMKLQEGDDVSFSMPGHRTATYRFARDKVGIWPMRIEMSSGVTVSVETTSVVYAAD